MTRILIGTPCYNGLVTTDYMLSLLGLHAELGRLGVGVGLVLTTSSLIPVARNHIVSRLLQNPQFTHLLFIDADLGFDPGVISRFLAADKDVVAGIYPIRHLDLDALRRLPAGTPAAAALNYAVLLRDEAQASADGFIQAEYATTGFMLIRRTVLERMVARYSELRYHHMFTAMPDSTPNEHLYALFDTSLDAERGLYLPEDYTFCKRWRAMGGEIWVDGLSKFTHVGPYAFHGDYSVFGNPIDIVG